MNKKYQTKQKTCICEYFEKNKQESFTAKELLENLEEKLEKVSKATLYRCLDSLLEQGIIIKELKDKNTTTYQYIGDESKCMIKCTHCGHISKAPIDMVKEIKEKYKITVDMLYGNCSKCTEDMYAKNFKK